MKSISRSRILLAVICLAAGGAALYGCSSLLTTQVQVENTTSFTIYCWLDGDYLGSISAGGTRTWDVEEGSHTMRATKSASYTDTPADVSFTVSAGDTAMLKVYSW